MNSVALSVLRGPASAAMIDTVASFATSAATMSIAATSLSGMNAAQARLDSAGHNIANLQTEGFRRQLVQQSSVAPAAGVTVSIGQASEPGNAEVDDMVGLIEAKHAFGANLMAFRTQDEMTASLLDIRA